jgi:FkbM family methyltransferase
MPRLATSPIAPLLGQRVPIRGPARLLHRSYAKVNGHQHYATRTLTSKLGDEFGVDLSSFLEWQIWAFGSFEEHFAELFQYLVGPGDRCIDVGANIGVHTVRLAKLVGQLGEVIAVEPDEELARRASNNVRLNHLSNVRVVQAAASGHPGDAVVLYRPNPRDPNRARASMLPHPYLTGSAMTVQTVSLDEINHGPVALIKIDVEGCESAVVAGAARTIESCSPSIVFEYCPELLTDKADSPFERLLRSRYQLFNIQLRRHGLTGRASVGLQPIRALPEEGGDILALSEAVASRLTRLVR